jgi:hypothetical protein
VAAGRCRLAPTAARHREAPRVAHREYQDFGDNPREELVWDQRALAAVGLITRSVSLPVAGLYPSLHLNLSECYRKLGDLARAREHLHRAQETIGALGDDDYGCLIRDGLEKVAEGLR